MERSTRFIALVFLFQISCFSKYHFRHDIIASIDKHDQIASKFDFYLKESDKTLRPNGWLPDTKCDGLLFNSLYAIIGGRSNPNLAESLRYPGKFYRSPEHDCFKKGLSRSECSRDMYLGYMLYLVFTDQSEPIERIISWGEKNSNKYLDEYLWIMCHGQPGAIEFRPNTIETAKLLLLYFNNARLNYKFDLQLSNRCQGYECHISAIHVWIRGSIRGYLVKKEYSFIESNAARYHQNAFFQALYARYSGKSQAIKRIESMLLNEKYFPNDRLPSSSDRCGFYLWERDPSGDSWKPCPNQGKIHSGLDFLLASAIYLGKI